MRMKRTSIFAAAAILAAVTAISPPFTQVMVTPVMAETDGLSDADKTAIKAMFKASTDALVKGDLATWAGYWTDDAVLMPPGHASVKGRKQLVDYVKANLSDLAEYTQSNWTFEGQGSLAVVTTDLLWDYKTGPNAGKSKKGKQVVVALKGADGAWKAQKVIFNTNAKP